MEIRKELLPYLMFEATKGEEVMAGEEKKAVEKDEKEEEAVVVVDLEKKEEEMQETQDSREPAKLLLKRLASKA